MNSNGSSSSVATFVMPFYADRPGALTHLERAYASVRAQTDENWTLVIVDDASPEPARRLLLDLRADDPKRVHVLRLPENRGPGECRNAGIRWAAETVHSPFLLFLDADDLAHPHRLERTRQLFEERADVDMAYSSFVVIDENDTLMSVNRLTPLISQILESHLDPVEGEDAWIRIGTETGYTSLTSTVAVRTSLALRYPFPDFRGSEDAYTWLRLSAGGGALAFLADVPGRYRVSGDSAGPSDRSRLGPVYYQRMAEAGIAGFLEAVEIALRRGRIDVTETPGVIDKLLHRVAQTLRREGQDDIADAVTHARSGLRAALAHQIFNWTPQLGLPA